MVKDLNEIIDLTKTSSLGIAVEDFKKSKIILINEIQFFQEELVEWIKIAIDIHHKHIYVCGLDGDFQRKKFGNWIEELLPFCDSYIKLSSFCIDCKKKKAIFTHRLSSETTQKVIGTDCYVPLCRFIVSSLIFFHKILVLSIASSFELVLLLNSDSPINVFFNESFSFLFSLTVS